MKDSNAMKALPVSPFPTPPIGVHRLDHRASVNAGLHYWHAVQSNLALSAATRETAATLAGIHVAAMVVLDDAIV
jgi:hypothetical protein